MCWVDLEATRLLLLVFSFQVDFVKSTGVLSFKLIAFFGCLGVLPRWCPGSDGGTSWRPFGQNCVLDAGLRSWLHQPKGIQKVARPEVRSVFFSFHFMVQVFFVHNCIIAFLPIFCPACPSGWIFFKKELVVYIILRVFSLFFFILLVNYFFIFFSKKNKW